MTPTLPTRTPAIRYSDLECQIIRRAWVARYKAFEISEILLKEAGTHRTRSAITGKITRMAICGRNRPIPSKDSWLAAAQRAAAEANIPLGCILGKDKRSKTVRARWRAWKELYGDGKTYSVSGIAKRVGVDHSSFFHARKMNFEHEMTCGQWRVQRGAVHPNSLANLKARRAAYALAEEGR